MYMYERILQASMGHCRGRGCTTDSELCPVDKESSAGSTPPIQKARHMLYLILEIEQDRVQSRRQQSGELSDHELNALEG